MHITFENIIGNLKKEIEEEKKMKKQESSKLVNLGLSNAVLLTPLILSNSL